MELIICSKYTSVVNPGIFKEIFSIYWLQICAILCLFQEFTCSFNPNRK